MLSGLLLITTPFAFILIFCLCYRVSRSPNSFIFLCSILLYSLFFAISCSFYNSPFSSQYYFLFLPIVEVAVRSIPVVLIAVKCFHFLPKMLAPTSVSPSFTPKLQSSLYFSFALGCALSHFIFSYLPLLSRGLTAATLRSQYCPTMSVFHLSSLKSIFSLYSHTVVFLNLLISKIEKKKYRFILTIIYYLVAEYSGLSIIKCSCLISLTLQLILIVIPGFLLMMNVLKKN
ncbi:hypothetical protein GEMRC1_009394 [Eukaryota sp. GEM-RC1]